MELIAVILKGDTSVQRFQDARTLLDWGFANYALYRIEPEAPLSPVPVRLGTADAVRPILAENGPLLLERSAAGGLRQRVTLEEGVDAPVTAGDRLGGLTVTTADGDLVAQIPLIAGEDVPRIAYPQVLVRLLRTALLAGTGSAGTGPAA